MTNICHGAWTKQETICNDSLLRCKHKCFKIDTARTALSFYHLPDSFSFHETQSERNDTILYTFSIPLYYLLILYLFPLFFLSSPFSKSLSVSLRLSMFLSVYLSRSLCLSFCIIFPLCLCLLVLYPLLFLYFSPCSLRFTTFLPFSFSYSFFLCFSIYPFYH